MHLNFETAGKEKVKGDIMAFIINGKKFNPDTSEILFQRGQGDAACRINGALSIMRSRKGTVWAVLAYWPNAYGPQKFETAVGESEVRKLCESLNRADAVEAAFGEIEEG